MPDEAQIALIHAEIDGELDGRQRGELARWLLADPAARAVHEELRRTCAMLDGLGELEPPQGLRQSILDALPQAPVGTSRPWWSMPRLRYAALIVGALTAATLVYETVHGPTPASDAAGTMVAGVRTTLDTVSLSNAAVSGRLRLYRDSAGLGIEFHLKANAPVDMVVAGGGRTLRFNGVGTPGEFAAADSAVALPGFGTSVQAVEVSLLIDGRGVGGATLRGSNRH